MIKTRVRSEDDNNNDDNIQNITFETCGTISSPVT